MFGQLSIATVTGGRTAHYCKKRSMSGLFGGWPDVQQLQLLQFKERSGALEINPCLVFSSK
jgi:hypothetical protein